MEKESHIHIFMIYISCDKPWRVSDWRNDVTILKMAQQAHVYVAVNLYGEWETSPTLTVVDHLVD